MKCVGFGLKIKKLGIWVLLLVLALYDDIQVERGYMFLENKDCVFYSLKLQAGGIKEVPDLWP